MRALQVYSYNGNEIAFDFTDTTQMINATEMAKPFGKLPTDFMLLKSTKEYIKALEKRYGNYHSEKIFKVLNGGNKRGTWMCRELAIRYAQWLNPDFAIWVDMKVIELLRNGYVDVRGKSKIEALQLIVGAMAENERKLNALEVNQNKLEERQNNIEADLKVVKAKTETDPDYFTVVAYASINKIKVNHTMAKSIGIAASKLCNERNIKTDKTTHPRFGTVKMYPQHILKEVFRNTTHNSTSS